MSAAHRSGAKPRAQKPDRRNIVVKLCRRELKRELLYASISVRPPDIYINESLTPLRSNLLCALRRAKRRFPERISACNSIEGRVYVWVPPSSAGDGDGRDIRLNIDTSDKLMDFCDKTLKVPLSSIVDSWPY